MISRRGLFRRLAQAGAAAVVGVALPKEVVAARPALTLNRMPATIREFVSSGMVNDGARALERIVWKAKNP